MKKLLAFTIVFLLLVGSIGYLWMRQITGSVFVPKKTNSVARTPTSIKEFFDTNTPFSILVTGYGGGAHEGTYLTDTMIIAHVDPAQKKVTLVSIPRDLWVFIPTNGQDGKHWKINAAYALGLDDRGYPNKLPQYTGVSGGMNLVKSVVSTVTGQTISYFVGLDFSGFIKTIDTLGGVDILVNPAFTDSEYPIEGKETDLCGKTEEDIPSLDQLAATSSAALAYPCRYETLHFDKGLTHMDGQTALKYVRSRHSQEDGTDFGRAQRQRNLILAVKDKIFSLGFIGNSISFINSLGGDARTDLSLSDVKTLIEKASDLNTYAVDTIALTDQNYLTITTAPDGQSILAPLEGIDSWSGIQTFLANSFAGKPIPVQPIVKVINGTKTPGLAQYATDQLTALHIATRPPGTAQNRQTAKTKVTVYTKEIPTDKLSQILSLFSVSSVTMATTGTPSSYTIEVTLGTDYQPVMSTTPAGE